MTTITDTSTTDTSTDTSNNTNISYTNALTGGEYDYSLTDYTQIDSSKVITGDYTLQASDANSVLLFHNTSPATITISDAIPLYSEVTVVLLIQTNVEFVFGDNVHTISTIGQSNIQAQLQGSVVKIMPVALNSSTGIYTTVVYGNITPKFGM